MYALLLIATVLAGQDTLPSAAAIVEKHLQAIGGPGAAAKVVSLARRGQFQIGGEVLPAEAYAKVPDRWQFIRELPSGYSMQHVWDGSAGWVHYPQGTRPLPPALRDLEAPAFDLSFLLPPRDLLGSMKVKGRETQRGRDVWVVETTSREGKQREAHFDVETGLLARVGVVVFEDYRNVEGLKLPYTLRFVDGETEQTFRTSDLRVNNPVEDARFEKGASTAAYRQALRGTTEQLLNRWLDGIDAGAARAVLENLYGFSGQDGRILYDLIASKRHKRGLEIGTAQGNSAVWMGMAFKKNGGRLITIEMDGRLAAAAMENFRKAQLDGVVDCRNNDAFKEIPLLEGNFDFVFLDTGTDLDVKFLDLVYARVQPGGAITAHNANDVEQREPDFFKTITTDSNLETKIIRTPTGGVSVSLKKR